MDWVTYLEIGLLFVEVGNWGCVARTSFTDQLGVGLRMVVGLSYRLFGRSSFSCVGRVRVNTQEYL
jgi:hypothetical protein